MKIEYIPPIETCQQEAVYLVDYRLGYSQYTFIGTVVVMRSRKVATKSHTIKLEYNEYRVEYRLRSLDFYKNGYYKNQINLKIIKTILNTF